MNAVNVTQHLPVAQRAMKVCACLRISVCLSSGKGSLCRMCSMKSRGVMAARFHFNLLRTTNSHSNRETERGKNRTKDNEYDWQDNIRRLHYPLYMDTGCRKFWLLSTSRPRWLEDGLFQNFSTICLAFADSTANETACSLFT